MRHILDIFLLIVILLLIQVLICNQIALFNVAVPFVYIYVVIRLNLGIGSNALFTVAFLTGAAVDIFSDTLGMNSTACLLLAVLKRPILLAYTQRDDESLKLTPGIYSMGIWDYSKYLSTMVLAYCLIYFGIEFFSLAYAGQIFLMGLSSAAITFCILLGIDSLLTPIRERL